MEVHQGQLVGTIPVHHVHRDDEDLFRVSMIPSLLASTGGTEVLSTDLSTPGPPYIGHGKTHSVDGDSVRNPREPSGSADRDNAQNPFGDTNKPHQSAGRDRSDVKLVGGGKDMISGDTPVIGGSSTKERHQEPPTVGPKTYRGRAGEDKDPRRLQPSGTHGPGSPTQTVGTTDQTTGQSTHSRTSSRVTQEKAGPLVVHLPQTRSPHSEDDEFIDEEDASSSSAPAAPKTSIAKKPKKPTKIGA